MASTWRPPARTGSNPTITSPMSGISIIQLTRWGIPNKLAGFSMLTLSCHHPQEQELDAFCLLDDNSFR
jgi:hypothetical protein